MCENERRSLMLRISWCCGKLHDSLCAPVGAEFGLTQNEMDVILFLHNNKELNTAKEISNYRSISKSLVCKSVKELLERGYITSSLDETDHRIQHLKLTKKAEPVAKKLSEAQADFIATVTKNITEDEEAALVSVLEKIAINVGAK